MRKTLILAFTVFAVSGCVENRGVPLPYSIAQALEFENYKDLLRGVRFYFGNQPHPAVEKSFGDRAASRKANAVGETPRKEFCARALTSTLLQLRAAALRVGGNAVINIQSNFRNDRRSSETQYLCAAGVWAATVALKGTIVKLRN